MSVDSKITAMAALGSLDLNLSLLRAVSALAEAQTTALVALARLPNLPEQSVTEISEALTCVKIAQGAIRDVSEKLESIISQMKTESDART